MKKFFSPFLIGILIIMMLIPFNSAFAYSGGLLNGVILDTGNSIDHIWGSTSSVTDNDLGTYHSLTLINSNYDSLIYKFDNPVDISAYQVNFTGGIQLSFRDAFGNNLFSKSMSVSNVSKVELENAVKDVAYIWIYNTSASTNTKVYEFDVWGSSSVVHGEISNLTASSTQTDVTLSWTSPTSLPHFTGVKIYKNGTLIKTLDKSVNQYMDDTIQPGTNYTYKVTAVYDDGFETGGITKSITIEDSEPEPKPETYPEINNGSFLGNNLIEFWGYVRMLLSAISPGIMLVTATAAVGFLLVIVIKAFRKSDEDENDDDDDIYYY